MDTIVKISDGLGNQMFQYAFGKYLANQRNGKLYLDITSYHKDKVRHFELFKIFPIQEELLPTTKTPFYKWKKFDSFLSRKLKNLRSIEYLWNIFWGTVMEPLIEKSTPSYLREKHGEKGFNSEYLTTNSQYLAGFWQSEKYFPNMKNVLLVDFSFKHTLDNKNQNIVLEMQKCNSISLHIRRGDYVTRKGIFNTILSPLPIDFYKKSILYISTLIKSPKFFIFSDDIERVKKNLDFPHEKVFINRNIKKESYRDMQLMSHCKHNIIANSSFSRRGARLNQNPEKIVIAPKQRFNGISNDSIIPHKWIKF